MSGVCATQEIRSVTQAYPVNEKQEGHGPDGRTKKLGSLHSAANALALGLLCCVCAHLRVRGGSFGRAHPIPGQIDGACLHSVWVLPVLSAQ